MTTALSQRFLNFLKQGNQCSQDLAAGLGLPVAVVAQELSVLELNGVIKKNPDESWLLCG
jgi:predicted Rossmann fold nucleotide-binding protein DprA/Smf involved in DNA uptake